MSNTSSNNNKPSNNKLVRNIIIGAILLFIITTLLKNNSSQSIPDNWKGKRLYNVVDGRDWIIINEDNSFVLHENIPNAEETYEWRGKVKDMTLIPTKKLVYQGRNDYKGTEIDPKMEFFDDGKDDGTISGGAGTFLRINFKYFSTISGSNETDARNYRLVNVSPF